MTPEKKKTAGEGAEKDSDDDEEDKEIKEDDLFQAPYSKKGAKMVRF